MSPVRHLVFGGGGLLGSGLVRELKSTQQLVSVASVRWGGSEETVDIESAVRQSPKAEIVYYWCAGKGVTSSSEQEFDREVRSFQWFLHTVETHCDPHSVVIYLASSAGALFAGSLERPLVDASKVAPLVAYGRAKLAMEDVLTGFAARTGVRAWIGRISNLFGPGQDLSKPQGLVSHAIRAGLSASPLTLWVPSQTRRDYLYVQDAARQVTRGCSWILEGATWRESVPRVILCDGITRDAAEVIGEVSERLGRKVPVVHQSSDKAIGQALDLPFTPTQFAGLHEMPRTAFGEAVDRTISDVRTRGQVEETRRGQD